MNADILRGLANANPFQPFTLRLKDGRKIRVPHRNFLTISGDGRTFTLFSGMSCDTLEVILVASCQLDDGHSVE